MRIVTFLGILFLLSDLRAQTNCPKHDDKAPAPLALVSSPTDNPANRAIGIGSESAHTDLCGCEEDSESIQSRTLDRPHRNQCCTIVLPAGVGRTPSYARSMVEVRFRAHNLQGCWRASRAASVCARQIRANVDLQWAVRMQVQEVSRSAHARLLVIGAISRTVHCTTPWSLSARYRGRSRGCSFVSGISI